MCEQEYEVKTYEVDYLCDECDKGVMRSTGQAYMSMPVQYPHKCEDCGAEKTFTGKKYPYNIYRRIEG